jgi:hypothetical protein
MKIRDAEESVRISIRAPLQTLLSILVTNGEGPVWDVLHSSFKPIDEPVYSIDPRIGESVEGILLDVRSVTITPASQLDPDADATPDMSYGTQVVFGEVPAGYRQRVPADGSAPKLRSGTSYFVRVWSTQGTERATFTKR